MNKGIVVMHRLRQVNGYRRIGRPTVLAQVVHQQDLPQILSGCSVQHAVHGAQERGPSLIMETDNDTGRRQRFAVLPPQTPVKLENSHTPQRK